MENCFLFVCYFVYNIILCCVQPTLAYKLITMQIIEFANPLVFIIESCSDQFPRLLRHTPDTWHLHIHDDVERTKPTQIVDYAIFFFFFMRPCESCTTRISIMRWIKMTRGNLKEKITAWTFLIRFIEKRQHWRRWRRRSGMWRRLVFTLTFKSSRL